MIDEYYTLSAVSLAGVLLCAVTLGVCFAFVALLVAAGARQSRRDDARIRAYVRDTCTVQADDLARRRRKRDRATMLPFIGPGGGAA